MKSRKAPNPINPGPCQVCGGPATREVRRFEAYRKKRVLAAWAWAFACDEHRAVVSAAIDADSEVRTSYGWSLTRVGAPA